MNRLDQIKKALENAKMDSLIFGQLRLDMEWLIEQAELLQKIGNRWVEIETNGTSEEADDFYTFVQDTLSPKPE